MIGITVTVAGGETLVSRFRSWEGKSRDMRTALRATKRAYIEYIAHVFDLEGPGWAPLRPRTVVRIGRSGGGILSDTGKMRASFTGGGNHVENVRFDSIEWGSSIKQAAPHETGFLNRGRYPGSKDGRYAPKRFYGSPVTARPVFRLMTPAEQGEFARAFENAFINALGI